MIICQLYAKHSIFEVEHYDRRNFAGNRSPHFQRPLPPNARKVELLELPLPILVPTCRLSCTVGRLHYSSFDQPLNCFRCGYVARSRLVHCSRDTHHSLVSHEMLSRPPPPTHEFMTPTKTIQQRANCLSRPDTYLMLFNRLLNDRRRAEFTLDRRCGLLQSSASF